MLCVVCPFFQNKYVYYHKNSPKPAISACKWNFGDTNFHCSNSVMRKLCAISCTSNERRETELWIHVYPINETIHYDRECLPWNPVSFYLGHTVYKQKENEESKHTGTLHLTKRWRYMASIMLATLSIEIKTYLVLLLSIWHVFTYYMYHNYCCGSVYCT